MKRPTLLAVIGVAALLCTLAMVANATDSCLVNLWAGPMVSDLHGHVQVTFYTIHSWPDCYCEHEPGTIQLQWRYVGDPWPMNWLDMDEFGIDLCELICYDLSFVVNHESTIDVRVQDTADTDDCHFGVAAWPVP